MFLYTLNRYNPNKIHCHDAKFLSSVSIGNKGMAIDLIMMSPQNGQSLAIRSSS